MIRISVLAICVVLFWNQATAQTAADGRRPYQTRCAGCHGEDGTGGGHGPNIVEVRRPRATSLNAVRDLILKGIPDGGMPPFQIPIGEADAIAAFVMTLKTPVAGAASTEVVALGDRTAGERFFAGKGNCTACHTVRGVPSGPGGVLGPDLTAIGRDRRPEQIEQKLRDPETTAAVQASRGGRGGPLPYRAVTVRTRDGQTLRGIAKNESAFDLQLLDMDGRLHLLSKNQVAEVIREKTLMPKVEATVEEMRDLVAYLSRLTGDPNSKAILATNKIGAGVRFADIADPKPGMWPTYDGNLSGNRFSPLKQIDTSNVGQLAPKWMFSLPGAQRALEVTPVVVDSVMYITSVNEAYACGLRWPAKVTAGE